MKRAFLIAIALTFFLTQSAKADTVIWDNPGGVITTFLALKNLYEKRHERVIIAGHCASACTLFLSLSNMCVLPSAEIGFHKSYLTPGLDYSKFTREELRESRIEADKLLWDSIPADIQPLLGRLTRRLKTLKGSDLPEKYICDEAKELDE